MSLLFTFILLYLAGMATLVVLLGLLVFLIVGSQRRREAFLSLAMRTVADMQRGQAQKRQVRRNRQEVQEKQRQKKEGVDKPPSQRLRL